MCREVLQYFFVSGHDFVKLKLYLLNSLFTLSARDAAHSNVLIRSGDIEDEKRGGGQQ